MSSLKVAAINNSSASSGGLSISTTGNVTGAGMDLITANTFSGASAVNIDNCFTSTYDHYYINFVLTAISADCSLTFYLRAGSNTTSNYRRDGMYSNASSVALVAGADSILMSPGGAWGNYAVGDMEIFQPAIAVATNALFRTRWIGSGGGGPNYQNAALIQTGSTAFNGFSLNATAGTISGTARVYGHRN